MEAAWARTQNTRPVSGLFYIR